MGVEVSEEEGDVEFMAGCVFERSGEGVWDVDVVAGYALWLFVLKLREKSRTGC